MYEIKIIKEKYRVPMHRVYMQIFALAGDIMAKTLIFLPNFNFSSNNSELMFKHKSENSQNISTLGKFSLP